MARKNFFLPKASVISTGLINVLISMFVTATVLAFPHKKSPMFDCWIVNVVLCYFQNIGHGSRNQVPKVSIIYHRLTVEISTLLTWN